MPVLVRTFPLSLPEVRDEDRERIMAGRLDRARERYFSVIIDKEPVDTAGVESLSAEDSSILIDIRNFPYEKETDKAVKLGFTAPTFTRRVVELCRSGYLKEEAVNQGQGMGKIKLYRLTEKGIAVGGGKQRLVGRGSLTHGYWMHVVKKHLERDSGLAVRLEHFIEGHSFSIDVAAYGPGDQKRLAVQIELNNNHHHSVENFTGCLSAGFPRVLVAAPAEYLLKGIKKEALNKEADLCNVEFKLLKEFLT